MAADMRGLSRGLWSKEAFASMLLSNRKAAQILSGFNCSACTDVTGFGLLGHLIEMLQCNNSGDLCSLQEQSQKPAAKLSLSCIPILPGAIECISKGVVSSLQVQVKIV